MSLQRLRDDDGQALLLALAFLLFFGLVIGVILGFAEASVRATTNLREQRSIAYAADGAMDGAIQYARTHLEAGAFGANPCITYTTTLNGKTATVTCVSVGNPLNADRRVFFTASVDGVPRVKADVIFDGVATPPSPASVVSWTYLR
jgi:Tfp pilus assembly protein PilX